jgi:crossover junction endodeoxyribonuclease RusA
MSSLDLPGRDQQPTTIRLPWPPGGLQPHAKGSWRPKAKATKAYREAAFWLAKEARVERDPNAVLTFTYLPPDRRRRDAQNLPGMLKPAVDGIAQAMGCDDNGFRCRFPDRFDEPTKGGAVVVQIGVST